MLRLLITILAVYLVLLLLQSTICRGVNQVVMGGYWWMCGDVAAARSTPTTGGVLGSLFGAGGNPMQVLQTGQQAWNTAMQHHDYFPPAGVRMPVDQSGYIFRHWCWKGVL